MTSDAAQQLTISAGEAAGGDRIDRFLASSLTGEEALSRTRVKALILEGAVPAALLALLAQAAFDAVERAFTPRGMR